MTYLDRLSRIATFRVEADTGPTSAVRRLQYAVAFRMCDNNRAENSHLPIRRRERKMLGFKSRDSVQWFLTTHAAIYNAFVLQRHMISRPTLRVFRAPEDSVWARAVA